MSTYYRTRIRSLRVQGYRSLHDVALEDLPEIVVLHGPNGAGKSNLLRAIQLLLRAMPIGDFPFGPRAAVSLSLGNANASLQLRPDDFSMGKVPRIRVELRVELGTRALQLALGTAETNGPVMVEIGAMFEMASEATIQFHFDRAHVVSDDPGDGKMDSTAKMLGPAFGVLRTEEAGVGYAQFLANRLRHLMFREILQPSDAYRVPGGSNDPQTALFESFLSEEPRRREAARNLGRRLAKAGFFGAGGDPIGLIPVDSKTYNEKQIRFRHPTHGEIPLRNLGSGEQQIVMMLAQDVITPYPIALLEEPEAHLHTSLMEPLARLLQDSVNPKEGNPDVDQLWIATHHHHFAIAPEFFDVSLDEKGATRVERKKRDLAAPHFYEPGPYWDTLRDLLRSGMSADTVVSLDADGKPIRAGEILASIEGDRRVANAFVAAATKAFVLSLAKDEPEA